MQKDQKLIQEESKAAAEDGMAALERQAVEAAARAPASAGAGFSTRFVSAGVESQSGDMHVPDGGKKATANVEEIELPEGDDSEEDESSEKVEIAQRNVPSAVFGDLAKVAESKKDEDAGAVDNGGGNHLGAYERFKRQRRQ